MENKVSYEKDVIQVKLLNVTKHPFYIAKIFAVVSDCGVNVDMISKVTLEDQSLIEFTCHLRDADKLNKAIQLLKQEHPTLEIFQSTKYAKLHVEGTAMKESVGVATKLFHLLASNDITFYQVTTSDTSITYLVDKDKIEQAVACVEGK